VVYTLITFIKNKDLTIHPLTSASGGKRFPFFKHRLKHAQTFPRWRGLGQENARPFFEYRTIEQGTRI